MRTQIAAALLLVLCPSSATAKAGAAAPSIGSLREIEARALPSAAEIETRALLAAARSELASGTSRLREGPTFSLEAGPRRTGGADRGDLAAAVDLPLSPAGRARGALRSALDRAEVVLPQGEALASRLRREELYLSAWLAQRSAALHREDEATVERWRSSAQARLEAGADPPFELALVDGELLRARLERAEAEREEALAWGQLAALTAGLPAAAPPLEDPPPASDPSSAADLGGSLLLQAADARLALEESEAGLAESRALSPWSVRGTVAREGLDTYGRIGLAYRLPLRGEPEALRARYEAERQAARRRREVEASTLAARLGSARERLRALPPDLPDLDFERALNALELRLAEGKDRASAALPLRRQLLEARLAGLRRRHAAYLTAAEIRALTAPVPQPTQPTQPETPR